MLKTPESRVHHQERSWCAGAGGAGVLRRRIPRIPDMGQLPPPDLDGRWSKPDPAAIFLPYKPNPDNLTQLLFQTLNMNVHLLTWLMRR